MAISPTDWIDARYAQITPAYWREHFTPASSFSPPPRKMKSMYEHYHASGFSWWLEETLGVRTVFCLQDADGTGGADCEFHGEGVSFWMEMFAIYPPPEKLQMTGRISLLDKLIRADLHSVPGNISINYGPLQALPDGPVLRRLAREIAIELSTRLSTSDEVALTAPLALQASKNTRMATTSWSVYRPGTWWTGVRGHAGRRCE